MLSARKRAGADASGRRKRRLRRSRRKAAGAGRIVRAPGSSPGPIVGRRKTARGHRPRADPRAAAAAVRRADRQPRSPVGRERRVAAPRPARTAANDPDCGHAQRGTRREISRPVRTDRTTAQTNLSAAVAAEERRASFAFLISFDREIRRITMNTATLVKRNLTHYWRTNLAVIFGVATAVAVLAGALLVGDSVRASLRDLALVRLGHADLVVTASGFFRERLADDMQSHDHFASNFNGACPIIALEAAVTRDENNARAGGVQIYGVDERFWKFHGANTQTPEGNDVLVSQALAQELGAKPGDTLILRIEKPSAIPAESLHGRKDDLGRTVRLTMREILPAASLGEFSLRPQQGAVRAVFVELKKLQKNLEQDDKANVILLAAKNANSQSAQIAAQLLKDKFALADLGLKLRALEEQQTISLESEGAVINDALADVVYRMPNTTHLDEIPVLTYLINTIRLGDREIPYSLATALAWRNMPGLSDTIINGGDVVTRSPDGREIVSPVSLTRTIN